MRAILSEAPGGPETLRLDQITGLSPGPGEVIIGVRAVGLNFADTLIIEDKYQVKPPRPFSPGGEAAGIVKAADAGVHHVKPGDRVIGHNFYGALAEEFRVEGAACFELPNCIPFDVAAGLITTYSSGLHGLQDRGQLQAGENLLVLGASGGMGVAAIELGKALGARVIAAASTPEKVAFAIDKGADVGICYPAGPNLSKDDQRAFSDAIKAETGGIGANVVYDPVGGDYAEPALRATAWNGRYLVLGFAAGIPKIPMNLCLLKGSSLIGVGAGGFMERAPEASARNVRRLIEFCVNGKIKPHVQARFPLTHAVDALRMIAERKAQGKVVVTVE